MFRGIGIGQGYGLVHVARHDELAVLQRAGCDFPARQQGQLTLHLFHHRPAEFGRGCDQHRLAVHAMLGLAQQVGCHKDRIGRLVRQDLHFRRTGRHVDGHIAQADQLLGGGDVLIARAEYLVHTRHTLRSIRHGTNGLHASGLEDTAHTGHAGGEKNGGMHLSVLARRGAQDDFLTAGYLCGNGQHQYRAEQGSRTTGDVQSHLLDGNRFLPAGYARLGLYPLAFKPLGSMKGLDILLGQADSCFQVLPYQALRLQHLFLGNGQRVQADFVELCLIIQYGAVSFRLYPVEYDTDRIKQAFHIQARTFQDFRPPGLVRIFYLYHGK